ncbi:SURF1 family protein [Amphiplicatus metriothermophilus]|uniref:SURF1-like protein n=1 Tax=Amphiplicatus metriothermophilus TaxID=1519374 RepID=A0A239PIW6_9PROT|nr:SURF1 family cytochrome oxidase biogenesis protein [Amphiplicatus metriothermophilus]MBB5517949.1 surfeit locus 1 family protein [Amphiplicatus metriothermophilus]SNT67718.1 surfeit locus 1 family protein [Amphiplicatus metriothermophilus]
MSFRFRPVLTVFVAIALAALIALGTWQLQRREWKLDLIAQVEARTQAAPIPFEEALARAGAGENMEYAPVVAVGAFAHDKEARVFGTLDGQAGAYVFAPIFPDTDEGRAIYINRGFVPQGAFAQGDYGRVEGPVRVEGLYRTAETPSGLARLFRPDDQPADRLWYVRDPRLFAARDGVDAPSAYIDSFGREEPADWPKGGATRLDFHNRHLEYALTWFGLAGALVGVYLVFSARR